jgi:hypothetical protein
MGNITFKIKNMINIIIQFIVMAMKSMGMIIIKMAITVMAVTMNTDMGKVLALVLNLR